MESIIIIIKFFIKVGKQVCMDYFYFKSYLKKQVINHFVNNLYLYYLTKAVFMNVINIMVIINFMR